MPTIKINLKQITDRSYKIEVECGLLLKIPTRIREMKERITQWAVISDSNVAAIYGVALCNKMRKMGLKTHLVTFPAGEKSKNRKVLSKIEDELFKIGLGRDGGILALGGGVTGDIAGFVAATYMRGIPFVQVPTTLLAMVDSSVGGKTGIDVPAGKNLVGAFYQPRAVFVDPYILRTLPAEEMQNGFAEIVKHAVIADAKMFALLEKQSGELMECNPNLLEPIIARNCAIKARIVEQDERESGLRQVLNYGHTVGHAIEKLSRYRISHGEAVAIGMTVESNIALKMGIMDENDVERQNYLLMRFGFIPEIPGRWKPDEIIEAMSSDKKVRGGKIQMVFPSKIGQMKRFGKDGWTTTPSSRVIAAAIQSLK